MKLLLIEICIGYFNYIDYILEIDSFVICDQDL